jgi:hypothetical protein
MAAQPHLRGAHRHVAAPLGGREAAAPAASRES